MAKELKAILVLEDGSIWKGKGFGSPKKVFGEVVFNTGMVGYVETLTDPSYKGQILVMTYPLIGNYGVPDFIYDEYGLPYSFESEKIQVSGLVVYEACKNPSHYYSKRNLHEWLKKENIPGIEGIDTREITKKLRKKGSMMGILEVSYDEIDENKLLKEIKKVKRYDEIVFKKEILIEKAIFYENKGDTIILIDCGCKVSIIRNLLNKGFKVVRVPYNISYDEVLSYKPKGIVISNGPGNPKQFKETIDLVQKLVDLNMPILGICLGNQIVALSLGGNTFKLKYGHRGQNKPVLNLFNFNVYITSQNHGYAVDPNSLKNLKVWWINIDDKTVEGLINLKKKILSVQFHPEASPGPIDTLFIFDVFKKIINKSDSNA